MVANIHRSAIRVQFHNLPLECFCEEAGLRLGGLLGEGLQVDVRSGLPCNIRFLRVWVRIGLEKPLISGISFSRPHRSCLWVWCSYERIYKVCRVCGLVGYTLP